MCLLRKESNCRYFSFSFPVFCHISSLPPSLPPCLPPSLPPSLSPLPPCLPASLPPFLPSLSHLLIYFSLSVISIILAVRTVWLLQRTLEFVIMLAAYPTTAQDRLTASKRMKQAETSDILTCPVCAACTSEFVSFLTYKKVTNFLYFLWSGSSYVCPPPLPAPVGTDCLKWEWVSMPFIAIALFSGKCLYADSTNTTIQCVPLCTIAGYTSCKCQGKNFQGQTFIV